MQFYSLYRDFFKFLESMKTQKDAWRPYREHYFNPHREFLYIYWTDYMGLKLEQLKERVRQIKPGDYSTLKAFISQTNLEEVCRETLKACFSRLYYPEELSVYLLVGFFSPEGFLIKVRNKWAIALGLERYRYFDKLPIILAHEYCHYVRRNHIGNDVRSMEDGLSALKELILSEGLSVFFTQKVFPNFPLYELLFISRGRWNWLRESAGELRQIFHRKLQTVGSDILTKHLFSGLGFQDLPPRFGYFLGYEIVKDYIKEHSEPAFLELIKKPAEEAL